MGGDNFKVDIISSSKGHFETAIEMVFDGAPGNKATHYKIEKIKRDKYEADESGEDEEDEVSSLILYWTDPKDDCSGTLPLPYPMKWQAAMDFCWHWLESGAEYGDQPDHDGSNGRGFRVSTGNFWGHVNNSHYSVCYIKPEWIMYGK